MSVYKSIFWSAVVVTTTAVGRSNTCTTVMIHNSYIAACNVHCGRSEATNLPQSPPQQGLFGPVRPTNRLCVFKVSTVVNGCLSATVWLRRDGDGTIFTYYYYYHISVHRRPPVESKPARATENSNKNNARLLYTLTEVHYRTI
jgi:hypothetical protein